jgi:hypothetical protein
MKVTILIICILILCSALCANPWTSTILSEVWFADNGHLFVELSTSPIYITNYNQVQIAHGDTIAQITQNIEITNVPAVIDVSELEPGLTFDPAGATLIVKYWFMDDYYPLDGVSWGYSQFEIRPPLPGQSLVKSHPDYLTLWDIGWFKDGPPTPGTSPYYPIARDTLIIFVASADGTPLQNFPIYLTDIDYICGYTNSAGIFVDTLKAGYLPIRLKHPGNNTVLYNQYFWLEPNETTFIPIEIDNSPTENSEEVVPASVDKGLIAYPSPVNIKKADALPFKYNGKSKLSHDSYIKLFDIKGRHICQITMTAKGIAYWKPNRDIGTGIYLARLISGNLVLDTKSITMIK